MKEFSVKIVQASKFCDDNLFLGTLATNTGIVGVLFSSLKDCILSVHAISTTFMRGIKRESNRLLQNNYFTSQLRGQAENLKKIFFPNEGMTPANVQAL
jgi:hypothetical protein